MSYAIEKLIDRFAQRAVARAPIEVAGASAAVVIRMARDADRAPLRDLAALDSSPPLTGPVLVALVDGRPWAAYALDDDRCIADPFEASAPAVGLLRVRATQLRSPRTWSRARRRRLPGRVGAR
jgi:hypothetical protein